MFLVVVTMAKTFYGESSMLSCLLPPSWELKVTKVVIFPCSSWTVVDITFMALLLLLLILKLYSALISMGFEI